MNRIVLIIPYFGKWPIWFDAHLISIKSNPSIDWLFFTDCPIPNYAPSNCRFIKSSMGEMEQLFSSKTEISTVLKKPYKLCDFKPAYGHIFEDYIHEYEFWGFTDIDIIWGNIAQYITENMLSTYEIINSRKKLIGGHFCIFRNTKELKCLYQKGNVYRQAFKSPEMKRFCEDSFSKIVSKVKQDGLSVKIDEYFVNQKNGKAHQEYYLDRWLWNDGKMFELKNGKPVNEVMYLHFINWKRTMKYCEVNYAENPTQFYISYNGVHYNTHSGLSKVLNRVKNLFDGYYVRLDRKKLNKKLRKLKRKIIKRL